MKTVAILKGESASIQEDAETMKSCLMKQFPGLAEEVV